MYPVSNAFFLQTKEDTQTPHLRGTIDNTITFTEDHILKESFSIQAQSTDATRVKIGTAFNKTLKLVIFHGVTSLARGQWENKELKIELGLNINGSMEWVPMGIFKVYRAVWTSRGISITAYDCMNNFDVPLDFTQTSGTPFELLNTACQTCGVVLGMIEEEVEALPNGSAILGVQDPINVPQYRDYIAFLSAMLGGFAEIYRDGKLYIRRYRQEIDDTVGSIERFKNPEFSDFVSYFTKITVTRDGEEFTYTGQDADDGGLIMELGSNPFIQIDDESTTDLHCQAIADSVAAIKYTPFQTAVLTSPYYDLGDVIEFTEGIAQGCISCVMAITYYLGKVQLFGYGDNPAYQNSKTAFDKAIGAATRSAESSITYHTFINSTPIEVTTNWTKLGQLAFGVRNQTITEVWHEMIFDMSGSDKVELQYYFDGTPVAYSPRTKFDSGGEHLLGTQMWMNTSGGQTHLWEVFARTKTGTAHIDAGDVHILLKGQGLSASQGWDGLITLTDEISTEIILNNIPSFSDDCGIVLRGPDNIYLSDVLTLGVVLNNIPRLTDAADLTSTTVRFKLKTEDGKYLCQEGGGKIKTEGVTRNG